MEMQYIILVLLAVVCVSISIRLFFETLYSLDFSKRYFLRDKVELYLTRLGESLNKSPIKIFSFLCRIVGLITISYLVYKIINLSISCI